MAKNEILKSSDFHSLGLCDGFAKVPSGIRDPEINDVTYEQPLRIYMKIYALVVVFRKYESQRKIKKLYLLSGGVCLYNHGQC